MNYIMIFVIGVIVGIILMAIIIAANNIRWGCRKEVGMIIEIPDDNSIVKWKKNDNDVWKSAEISDLIKAYEERPQGETKNPREGMDFNDYLAEQLKDPEFRKEWENVLKEEENETN